MPELRDSIYGLAEEHGIINLDDKLVTAILQAVEQAMLGEKVRLVLDRDNPLEGHLHIKAVPVEKIKELLK